MSQSIKLNQTSVGFLGLITSIDGDQSLKRKLMSLGLRQGQQVSILHHRKNGVVVSSNGSRIALGDNVAAKIYIQQIFPEETA
jgi:Fe2+ transport system protein FeoA